MLLQELRLTLKIGSDKISGKPKVFAVCSPSESISSSFEKNIRIIVAMRITIVATLSMGICIPVSPPILNI